MAQVKFKFRPHHFLCAYCYQGEGYSTNFVRNFNRIVQHLNSPEGDAQTIHITYETDTICKPCPHHRGHQCQFQHKVRQLDTHHAQALQLKGATQLTWATAKQRIRQHIDLATFKSICRSCDWYSSGLCENVIRQHVVL